MIVSRGGSVDWRAIVAAAAGSALMSRRGLRIVRRRSEDTQLPLHCPPEAFAPLYQPTERSFVAFRRLDLRRRSSPAAIEGFGLGKQPLDHRKVPIGFHLQQREHFARYRLDTLQRSFRGVHPQHRPIDPPADGGARLPPHGSTVDRSGYQLAESHGEIGGTLPRRVDLNPEDPVTQLEPWNGNGSTGQCLRYLVAQRRQVALHCQVAL